MIKELKHSMLVAGLLTLGVVPVASAAECPPLLNHTFPGLQDGKPRSLCQYHGKQWLEKVFSLQGLYLNHIADKHL